MITVLSHAGDETYQLGYELGRLLQSGDAICLSGDLGAGKTTFVRGLAAGWGVMEGITSPTFVIVHQHHRPTDSQILSHLDAYRLTSAADQETIGLEDILALDGVTVIEWAEHIQSALPSEYLWIRLIYDQLAENTRLVEITPTGSRAETLLRDWEKIIHVIGD